MEIGTEISQKIRSAIKAKLIELGAYVDDELPDYIMVMVANKKTQQQMTDDLNLFLNVHTETFTTWLHSLLRKLQSINTDQPILSDEPPGKDKDKAKSKEKHKGEKKKRVHSDKADKAHSGKLQSEKARVEKSHSEKSHSEKTHSSKSHAEKPHSSKSHSERTRTTKSHSAKAHAGKSQSEKLHPEKSHTERHRKSSESSKQKRSSSKEQPKAEPESAPPPPTEEAVKSGDDEASSDKPTTTEPTVEAVTVETEEIKDEINITENTDEFAEEVKEEKVKKRTRSKSPTPKVTPAAKADKHSDAKKAKKSSSAKVSSRKKEERKDPVSKSKPEVEKRKRSPSSSSDSKKQPSSVVGIHKRRYEELEVEEESYDPMNPAVGNVASGIRVPARKSSVPKSLQANRSLLMKAVTEAERSVAIGKQVSDKSVKKSRRKRSPEVRSQNLTGRMKTAAGLQLISKSRRQEMLQKMTYTVDNESPAKTDEGRTDDSDSRDSIPNLKYTVKNEPAETSPKSKAISKAMAPSRVAASALKEISKNVVKDQHTTEVAGSDDEGDTTNSETGEEYYETSEESSVESDGESNSEASAEDSGSEYEIEITDRAAQTDISAMKGNLAQIKAKGVSCKTAQTDVPYLVQGEGHRLTKEKVYEIDQSLLNLFIGSLMSFDVVENESFKTFTKTLELKYHLPKRKKVLADIGMLYNNVKDNIKDSLSGVVSVTFTHNSWTNIASELYDTVNVHFITDNWKLRSAVLKTALVQPENICETIAQNLEESRIKWDLPRPFLVTHNSSDELRLLEMLDWKRNVCFGNCISKMVKKCLNDSEVSELLEKQKFLVYEFGSRTVKDVFEDKKYLLIQEPTRGKKLGKSEVSSWDELSDVLSTFVEQTPAIHATVMDTELINRGIDMRNQLFTFEEQSSLECLVKILSTFMTATEMLTNTDSTTLQKVIPTFVKVQKVLQDDKDDTDVVERIKLEMKQQINSTLAESHSICLLACLVHPQTKQMAFVSQEDRDRVKEILFNEVREQIVTERLAKDMQQKIEIEKREKQEREKNENNKSKGVDDKREKNELASKDMHLVVINPDTEAKSENENSSENSASIADDQSSLNNAENDSESQNGSTSGKVSESNIESCEKEKEQSQADTPLHEVQKVKDFTVSASSMKLRKVSTSKETDWLHDVIHAEGLPQKSAEESAKIEVDLFMAESVCNKNPLHWWREKQLLYPRISRVARRVLSIPASSLSSPDVFKLASDPEFKHCLLKPEHVDMMIFLKKNRNVFE